MKGALFGLIVLSTSVACLACVEPEQYGGPIPIEPLGVEARLAHMCAIAPGPLCDTLAGPRVEDAAFEDAALEDAAVDASDSAVVSELQAPEADRVVPARHFFE